WRRLQTIFRRHQEAQPPDAQNTETLAATGAALQTTPGTPEPGTAEQAASAGPQPPPAVAATTERPAGPDQAPSTGATPAREDPRQSGATEPATATPDIEAGTIAARDEVMGSLPEPGAVSTDQAPGPVAEQPDRQRLRPRGIDRGAAEAQEPALSAARPTAREVPSAAPQADRPAADREREEPDSQAVPRTAIQPEGEPSIETRTAAPPLRAGLDQIEETSATLIEPESPRPDRMPGITDEGTVPRQPPLEEVWQVERVPLSRRRQPVTPPAQATGALASAGVQRPRDAERHAIDVGPEDGAAASRYPTRAPTSPAEAGAVLQRVAAARTTSSSIETIPPRRPRPARRPEPETTAPPPRLDVQPASDATRPPAPETRLATEQMEASGPSQRVPEDRGALIQRPEVQRPQGSVAGTGTPAIPVVTTEIGPLPSDLWELIGEQPPETPERSAAGEPAILRAVPQARPATGSQATPLIQRAAMATTAQAPTVSVPADGDAALAPASAMQAQRQAEPEAETAQAAVDLEKLAQRVYAELKRRLMVEWERLRGP
ncbi:MAG: hypothetical protein JXC32_05685, partial [Anaerolineae bacterium]|nr:hypothetical protein [Anaerolineae bacterium]